MAAVSCAAAVLSERWSSLTGHQRTNGSPPDSGHTIAFAGAIGQHHFPVMQAGEPLREGRLARDHRRLAAIVSADVVGYSLLMGRDDSATLAG